MSVRDPGTNYAIIEVLAATEYAADSHEGTAIDHSLYPCVSFFVSVGVVGSSATVDMKVQYRDNNSSDWTDEPDTTAGNDTAITQITAAGTAQLNVPNPRGRYSRVVATVATAACDLCVTAVAGPYRHISA